MVLIPETSNFLLTDGNRFFTVSTTGVVTQLESFIGDNVAGLVYKGSTLYGIIDGYQLAEIDLEEEEYDIINVVTLVDAPDEGKIKFGSIDSMTNLNETIYLTGWAFNFDEGIEYYVLASLDVETGIATYINTLPVDGKINN